MSDDRPTTWTQPNPDHWDGWERCTGTGWQTTRMMVWPRNYDGRWTYCVDAVRGATVGRIFDPWEREGGCGEAEPTFPTRELAQAAAEEWVREWARGLLEAVGTGEPSGIPGELEPALSRLRGLTFSRIATWCPECGAAVTIDEDGCCATCGNGATGPGAEQAIAALIAAEGKAP